jgi:hypothetical protein
MNDDRELVLAMLMDIKENHPHALYAAGIDPSAVSDMDSLLEQVGSSKSSNTLLFETFSLKLMNFFCIALGP